jgi:hypothetical protein
MRTNLARNCSLDGAAEEREKKPILDFSPETIMNEQEWSPTLTLQKLQEMTKNSNFKGMAQTKEAGEDFIAEKASFLLYLAHSHRLEEKFGKLEAGKSQNLIGKIFGEKSEEEMEL